MSSTSEDKTEPGWRSPPRGGFQVTALEDASASLTDVALTLSDLSRELRCSDGPPPGFETRVAAYLRAAGNSLLAAATACDGRRPAPGNRLR